MFNIADQTMKLIGNPRFTSLLKCVSQLSVEIQLKPSISGSGFLFRVSQNPRSLSTQRTVANEIAGGKSSVRSRNGIKVTPSVRKMAEDAMLDYFYSTRGLQYMISETMSKNTPFFIENLLKKLYIDADADIGQTVNRYLRFHPVNEFEPFLESLGLKPTEYSHLVPHDKMFLNEDVLLLENHNILCYCGINPKKMGKIFKEAKEIFSYENGVLASKIQAYEDLGFSKSFLSKLIICSPSILIGNINVELAKVLEMLKSIGLDVDWVTKNISEDAFYDWNNVHRVLVLLREICLHDDELCVLIRKRPKLVFENSGESTLILAGFQTKLGSSRKELLSLFQKFPQIQVGKCVSNLRHCFMFLKEIEMEDDEICKVFCSHSWWLASCPLKKTSSLLNNLKSGKKRLCQVIQENPEEMKKWTMLSKIQPLPDNGEETKSKIMKIQFLLDLGYIENSKEMEKAIKDFRGKGSELRERFNFLMSLGLDEKDARDMVKTSPNILSQACDVLETKVKYLVNELGYPFSSLVAFPSCLKFTLQRMKIRFSMFSWLQLQGKADPKLAISTILACSDRYFDTKFVGRHPDGPKKMEELKKLHL